MSDFYQTLKYNSNILGEKSKRHLCLIEIWRIDTHRFQFLCVSRLSLFLVLILYEAFKCLRGLWDIWHRPSPRVISSALVPQTKRHAVRNKTTFFHTDMRRRRHRTFTKLDFLLQPRFIFSRGVTTALIGQSTIFYFFAGHMFLLLRRQIHCLCPSSIYLTV